MRKNPVEKHTILVFKQNEERKTTAGILQYLTGCLTVGWLDFLLFWPTLP